LICKYKICTELISKLKLIQYLDCGQLLDGHTNLIRENIVNKKDITHFIRRNCQK